MRIQRLLLILLIGVGVAASLRAQDRYDLVIFDDDDPIGLGYYDASVGAAKDGVMTLIGPFRDKMPVVTNQVWRGLHSGLVEWKTSAGPWVLRVFSPGFVARDLAGYSNIVFYLNGPAAIPAAQLPRLGLNSQSNRSTDAIGLAKYLPEGLNGDPVTWQKASIPLTDFPNGGDFDPARFMAVYFTNGSPDTVLRTLWIDDLRITSGVAPQGRIPEPPSNLVVRSGERSIVLHWDAETDSSIAGFHVFRFDEQEGKFIKITGQPETGRSFADMDVTNGRAYRYRVSAVNQAGLEGRPSQDVSAIPKPFKQDSDFLEYLQHAAFDYFWYEANPKNGLIRDRNQPTSASSIAAVGFGLTGIGIAIDRGWITREQGRDRTLVTLKTFWEKPQGTNASGTIGYKGWFYHFIDMETGGRAGASELSSIDSALLFGGVLYARQYFDRDDASEREIQRLAEAIYNRVDWQWMTGDGDSLTMGWMPESGFLTSRWIGYNEAMLLYVMAIGADVHAIPKGQWQTWTNGYKWERHYGHSFVIFPPLFGHQYSHCWIDFRGIADAYMREKGIDYFENSRRATLAQREYALANPKGFSGYGANVWGFTACDGPGAPGTFAYMARGTPPAEQDDGTIAPTAPGGSIPFAPEVCIPALRHMYDQFRADIWTGYGFRDAFNLSVGWFGSDVIGIDQGAILLMAENYRSEAVWKLFMRNPEIQRGLKLVGFGPLNQSSSGGR